jgi:hypothetical protein
VKLGRGRRPLAKEAAVRPTAPAPAVPPEGPGVIDLPGRPYGCHVGTSNRSFLVVSRVLADAGVRNNKFMLAIFDSGLHGLDPFDESLSDEMKGRISAEIIRNPWYFIREIVRIPIPGGIVPFEIHLGNLFLFWCMVANLNFFLILPRQNYKTVSACCFYLWAYCFGTTNSHILFFNKELSDSKNNLRRVKDVYEGLPDWMRLGMLTNQIDDRMNIEFIMSGDRKNRIDAKPAGKDPSHADAQGRGATVPLKWFDEITFAKYIKETYMAAAPAGAEAMALAAMNGRPYGTAITTTPNNLDNPSAAFAFEIKTGSLQFRLAMYDYGPTRVREMIDSQAEMPFVFAQYTWKEIGRSEAWYRTQCRELLNDKVKIKRELDLVWPLSGSGSVFDEDSLDALARHQKQVMAVLPIRLKDGGVPPGLEILWVEPPNLDLNYVIGFDTASGENRDYHAMVICHPDDMRTCGMLRTNSTDTEAMREVVRYVFCVLLPKSVIVTERNYLGIVMINFMLKECALEARMFYVKKEKVAQRTLGVSGRSLAVKRPVREYGVNTDKGSREAMIRHLFQIVEELPHLVQIAVLQDEIRTLQRKASGKVEHREGFHDDVVFAFLMVQYADRHDQGVLRDLLSRSKGLGRADGAMRMAALNIGAGAPAQDTRVPGPMEEGEERETVRRLEDYLKRAELQGENDAALKRKKTMIDMIADLNGAEIPV